MDVRTVAVLGAGTMGAGIAQVAAQAGFATRLFDAQEKALARGMDTISEFWKKGIDLGKTRVEDRDAWAGRLSAATSMEAAVGDADMVIEAVPEVLSLKQKIFEDLDRLAPKHAVLASNTSSLSISAIASAVADPARVVGMHFFNPVPLMKLLELVRHDGTSEKTVDAARAVGERMGKTVIVVRDMPGFATSRLGVVIGNEAMRMLESGVASARDIDLAMKLGYGHPMGPLELTDLVGLDVREKVSDYLYSQYGGTQYESPEIARRLVAAGDLGRKTGRGIYDWSNGTPRERELPRT